MVRRLVLGLLVLALVAAACGDDDDGGGAALSESEYLAQGNAVCEQAAAEFDELFETGFPSTPEKLTTFFEEATEIVRREVDALRALEPPEALEADVDEMLELGDAVLADFEEASEDAEKAAEVFQAEGGSNDQAFQEKAEEIGLTACAEDGDGGDGPELLDPATFSPEKRAFVEQADTACAAASERETELEEQHLTTFPPPLEDWAEFLPAVAEVNRGLLAELRAMTPPAGDEAEVEAAYAALEDLVDEFDELAGLAEAGETDAFDEGLTALFPRFEELGRQFAAYGFQTCGIDDDE